MSGPSEPPTSVRVLTKLVDTYARERGLAPKRVRDWISYMIVCGRLEGAGAVADGPRFTIKGAVAIEMRLPSTARATKDIDLVIDNLPDADLTVALRNALEGDYQSFAFRVKGEPYIMPNNSVRVDVALDYRGRSWGTVQVDLSPREGESTEVELVEALARRGHPERAVSGSGGPPTDKRADERSRRSAGSLRGGVSDSGYPWLAAPARSAGLLAGALHKARPGSLATRSQPGRRGPGGADVH